MKTVQNTLFVITALILTTQTVRHFYVRSLEPTGSVLDKYESKTTEDIKKADSLDELVKLYDEAYNKVKAADAEIEAREARQADATQPNNDAKDNDIEIDGRRPDREPYKSERLLKEAIVDWESKSHQVFELHFFWFSGLGFLIIGFLFYTRKFPWLGLALIIAAFSEMLWATCPAFRALSGSEFNRLLTHKAIFSLLSLILLFVLGYFIRRFDARKEGQKALS